MRAILSLQMQDFPFNPDQKMVSISIYRRNQEYKVARRCREIRQIENKKNP